VIQRVSVSSGTCIVMVAAANGLATVYNNRAMVCIVLLAQYRVLYSCSNVEIHPIPLSIPLFLNII